MPAPDLMTAELTHWPHHDGYLLGSIGDVVVANRPIAPSRFAG